MSNLWSKWCQETNRYAHQLKESATIPGKLAKWTETTVNEIYTFLAAVILMGLVRKNSLKDYWSTDPVTQTPFFSALLSLDRFQLLQRALHFADNATANLRDPLNKIRSVFTSLMAGFGQMFIPHRDLCINESLLLWKGWLGFRQYIPSKRKRFGIKLFMLCDVLTGLHHQCGSVHWLQHRHHTHSRTWCVWLSSADTTEAILGERAYSEKRRTGVPVVHVQSPAERLVEQ